MIQITDKSQCSGCTACMNVCPKHCISMQEDNEGFLYPAVDATHCIDCHLCEKVCPVIHQHDMREPLHVYAAKNPNEQIRMESSSGGIFTMLSEAVIGKGGVVFGARFDDKWDVVHDYTETIEGLAAFRGSKYVQSQMRDSYAVAERFLKAGREVMFTGTSCQIAGLKNYLRKEYDNLLAVDVVCHGVPSPKVWRIYLDEIARQGGKNTVLPHHRREKAEIRQVNFRSKSTGWKKFSFALTLSEANADGEQNSVLLSNCFTENPYMNIFLANISLRPSCYACPAKAGKSGSDITIADYWGIKKVLPEYDDDKGVSLILEFSEKGKQWLDSLNCEYIETTYEQAQRMNYSILKPVNKPIYRDYFFRQLERRNNFAQAAERSMRKINRRAKVRQTIKKIVIAIIPGYKRK